MMTERKVYPKDVIAIKARNGKRLIGVVEQVSGLETDSDSEFEDEAPLQPEMVRVMWYPRGNWEQINENRVTVIDRSCLPRDVVRMPSSEQLGTVIGMRVEADLVALGSGKTIRNVPLEKCRVMLPIVENDVVYVDNMIGRVEDITGYYVLKFANNSRYSYPLYDDNAFDELHPNISDMAGFCHEAFSMYPGQKMAGNGSCFDNAEWLEGPEIKFKKRTRYSFIIEKIQLSSATVKWLFAQWSCDSKELEAKLSEISAKPLKPFEDNTQTQTISEEDVNISVTIAPGIVVGEQLERMKPFNHFWCGDVSIGDRFLYDITDADAQTLNSQKSRKYEPRGKRRKRKSRKPSGSSQGRSSSKKRVEMAHDSSDESDHNHNVLETQGSGNIALNGNRASTESTLSVPYNDGDKATLKNETRESVFKENSFDISATLALKLSETIFYLIYGKEEPVFITVNGEKIDLSNVESFKKLLDGNYRVRKQTESWKDYLLYIVDTVLLVKRESCFSQGRSIDYWIRIHTEDACWKGQIDCNDIKTFEEDFGQENFDHPLKKERIINLLKLSVPETNVSNGKQEKNQYKCGQSLSVEISKTCSYVDIQWQDGTISTNVNSSLVQPAHHVDEHDFCPGDFVLDKRSSENKPSLYGVVLKADTKSRMVSVCWLNKDEEKVETISAYDVSDHPKYTFRISDIIIVKDKNAKALKAGELMCVTDEGKLKVAWVDGTTGLADPENVSSISPDDSEHFTHDGSASSSFDDSSGSWESCTSGEEFTDSIQDVSSMDVDSPADPKSVELANSLQNKNDAQPSIDPANTLYSDIHFIDEDLESPDPKPDGSKAIKRHNGVANQATMQTEENSAESGVETLPAVFLGHHFANTKFEQVNQKAFLRAMTRDLKLIRSANSKGIYVKTYEDSLHLLSVMIKAPKNTPYEHGVYFFDVMFPPRYPNEPPQVHYVSYAPRLNPNLYVDGTVCVSLLGTWRGKGNEKWTKESNLLQVLLSIQGLILNAEPYYNEAGYEDHRGTAEGQRNSRNYNEMVMLRLVEHASNVLKNPPKPFMHETMDHCKKHVPLLIKFIKSIVVVNSDDEVKAIQKDLEFPLLPISTGCMESLKLKLIDLELTAAQKLNH